MSTGSRHVGRAAAPAPAPAPDEVWARLREAAARSRDHAAAAVSALREERAEIDRERRAHPSYDEARRERARQRSSGEERTPGPP